MSHPLREPLEFYVTPPEATRALLSVERFANPVWEPACGDGAIAKVLLAAGYQVVASDLVQRGYGQAGVNFLDATHNRGRSIVTNPPYGSGLADAFLRRALSLAFPAGGAVALLLDLASLAHPRRTALWQRHPPASVHILDELICQPAGRPRITEPTMRFCWCVWRPHHQEPTRLGWLQPRKFQT